MERTVFEDLNLDPQVLRAVREMGFEETTPIQAQAIPAMMAGHDLIGQAQTGTGKTAAFGIPLLHKVDPELHKPQAIILCPTRELAVQVSDELHRLAKYLHNIRILPIYGGQDMNRQIRSLKGGVQILVGTPGRVMDHLRRKTIRCEFVETVVLDEADEMLAMGFREDIETILQYIPQEHQTVLFSATMPREILEITDQYQTDAVQIRVTRKELTVENIEQYYFDIRRRDKLDVLTRCLDYYDPQRSLIFCNTKHMVDELTGELQNRGYLAEGLHGDLKQQQRDRVMKDFRTGKTEILVATDVAARGIDVDDIEVVFNYDLPQDDEYYVHRIGRTGRAGKPGKAYSFVRGKEVYKLKEIMRYCKTRIYAERIPTLQDVEEAKCEKIMENLDRIIEERDLTKMVNLIEAQVNHSDCTAMDIAAAFLYLALGKEERKVLPDEETLLADTGAGEEGMVRLFINVGRRDHIRSGDILGAVAGESGMPGNLVGAIDIYENYTFVEVPREYGPAVLHAMKNVKIKGRPVNVEPANAK